jgi:hypothetical protein
MRSQKKKRKKTNKKEPTQKDKWQKEKMEDLLQEAQVINRQSQITKIVSQQTN